MTFSTFIPSSVREWILYVIIAILLCVVLLFNKAAMKSKALLQEYIDENKSLKGEDVDGRSS